MLGAEGAGERPFAGVKAHVRVEAAGLREGLVAEGAVERLGAGVRLHVLDELAGLGEAFAARGEWSGEVWFRVIFNLP